jgi:hypothetical protein
MVRKTERFDSLIGIYGFRNPGMWWILGRGRHNRVRRSQQPRLEHLETRALLYALTGQSWSNPAHISYSIVGDGVSWDHGTSNLNARLNTQAGSDVWKRELARALQTWASVANINITRANDSNLPFDVAGQAQGDTRFGDIRIGGHAFHDRNILAQTFFPPPNGRTAAGDSEINTAIHWSIGSGIDLYSVMLHEFGHALGLDHSHVPGAVMDPIYGGVRSGLLPDDIAGIQAIYGPRLPDSYQAHGQGVSFASAIDLTNGLNSQEQETLSGVALATIGDTEYFAVNAPALAGLHLQVTAEAADVSLLSPKVTVFDAAQTPLASGANPADWGDSVQATANPVVPGARYYIAVTGATNDVFATGAYRLDVSFSSGPPPSPSPPPAATAILPDRFEPNNTIAQATPLGSVAHSQIVGLTLDTASDLDFFQFQTAQAGKYVVTAPGAILHLRNARGRTLAQGNGSLAFRSARAGTHYYVVVSAFHHAALANYTLTITV